MPLIVLFAKFRPKSRARWGLIHPSLLMALVSLVLAGSTLNAKTVLFDATKAEMAGNADWVIDADSHNLGLSTGPAILNGGSESNPQQIPTPSASGITASTSETYWQGALSSWGVGLVKNGYSVQSLPYNGRITFGDSTNAQDLSNYNVFVVDEPNILFTSTEKTALINFVSNGGGLFMISDHTVSDRNNDGSDSVQIWNDFLTNNSTGTNPFGVTVNVNNISVSSGMSIDSTASDPITHGIGGTPTAYLYHNGATLTIDTSLNPNVSAAIWTSSSRSNSNVMVAYGTYGLGHFVMTGDSSPFDDGTGDPNDTLFGGWGTDGGSQVALNGTDYISTRSFRAIPEPGGWLGVLGALLGWAGGRGVRGSRAAEGVRAAPPATG